MLAMPTSSYCTRLAESLELVDNRTIVQDLTTLHVLRMQSERRRLFTSAEKKYL